MGGFIPTSIHPPRVSSLLHPFRDVANLKLPDLYKTLSILILHILQFDTPEKNKVFNGQMHVPHAELMVRPIDPWHKPPTPILVPPSSFPASGGWSISGRCYKVICPLSQFTALKNRAEQREEMEK